jgi:hypothetical protein
MVNEAKARSTHIRDSESVETLTAKCEEHASGWAEIAVRLDGCNSAIKEVRPEDPLNTRKEVKMEKTPEMSDIYNPV